MNGTTWEEETLAGIRNRLAYAQQQREKAEQEADYWIRHTDALEKVLELERQRRGIKVNGEQTVDPQSLRGKSVRQALIQIGHQSNGLVIVRDAVAILVQAKVFEKRDQARNAIYSTLHSGKRYFQKEQPGVYRLTELARAQPVLVP